MFTCRTTDFSCTYSPKLHREVLALRNQGKSAQQVIDAFVEKYGEKALMAPKPKGFNLAGYLVPGAAIATAGAALVLLISRRRAALASATAGGRVRPAGGSQPRGTGPAPAGARRGRGLMGLEVVAAALVGLAAVWLVLQPLVLPGRARTPVYEPLDPEETPKGVALAALKEIEFDRETGKLSDEDYDFLKAKYTGVALDALRAEAAEAAEVGVASPIGEAGREWRCRGHDRCPGSRPPLRCDLGTAWCSRLFDLRTASGGGRGVLFDLRTPVAAGRRLRRLWRRAGARQPILRAVRDRGGGVAALPVTAACHRCR